MFRLPEKFFKRNEREPAPVSRMRRADARYGPVFRAAQKTKQKALGNNEDPRRSRIQI